MVQFADVQEAGPRLYVTQSGLYVPSVSEVLSVIEKRHFEKWRKDVGRQEADRKTGDAKRIGTAVHKIAADIARGRTPAVEAEFELYERAVRAFLDQFVARILGVEVMIASDRLRFAGQTDLYCRMKDGGYAVIDYKTSMDGYPTREHGLQTAGYAALIRDTGRKVDRRIAVGVKKREGKQGEFHVREFEDHVESTGAFLGLVDYWNWAHFRKLIKAQEENRGGINGNGKN